MTSGIYAYWDNEKDYYAYVGKDFNIGINRRHKDHLSPSKHNVQPFNKIIQNNPDRYEYRIIMKGDYNDWQLNQMEKLCIKSFKTFKYDYPERSVFNFTKGGEGSSGRIVSDETKKKISEAQKGEKNHNYGKPRSDETKMNISKSQNTSGYFRVSKKECKECNQGFRYRYLYYKDGKQKEISSISLDKLEKKVLSKGLPWRKL